MVIFQSVEAEELIDEGYGVVDLSREDEVFDFVSLFDHVQVVEEYDLLVVCNDVEFHGHFDGSFFVPVDDEVVQKQYGQSLFVVVIETRIN